MKFAGLLMTVIACIYFALVKLKAIQSRINSLQAACECLRFIRSELSLNLDTLQETFRHISLRPYEGINIFFQHLCDELNALGERTFGQIWTECTVEYFENLLEDELYELSKLGDILGRCSADMQLDALENCEKYLSSSLIKQRNEYPQIRKLYLGLSAAAGSMLLILMV